MNDEDIDKQIIDQLYWDNRVKVSEVAVTVDKGWVTLDGEVPSYKAKKTAAEDAYLVRGVKYVNNKLVVRYDSIHSDKKIKENVEMALEWDPYLDASKIDVAVDEGSVELSGTVDAYWKKILVEDYTYGIYGVLDVKNELAIVTSNKWSDEMIASDIENALARNHNVDINDIDVKVNKAKVTLSGTVPDWTAKYAADGSALYTAGVKHVDNKITIS
jgi:hyperosmotically inducible protein